MHRSRTRPPRPITCNSVTLQNSCLSTTILPSSQSERDTSSGGSIKRKPGETPTELAARVRQMATTCDFPAIKNPLDEAMRTCIICAINNEAVLKSVFREPEEKLTFSKAVDIATEVEEAAKNSKRPKFTQNQRKSTRSKRRSSTITIRSHHHLPNNHPVHRHSVIVVERKVMR